MTSKHQQHEEIAMLNDLLDYLNTHQMNTLEWWEETGQVHKIK